MELSLSTYGDGDHKVVKLGGALDVYTAPKLREELVELLAGGTYSIVIDMEDLDFLDSSGLGVLVGGLKRVRAHAGTLQLVCTHEQILKLFRITGLIRVFRVQASVADALAAID